MTPGPDTSIQDTPTRTGTSRQQFVFLSGTAFDSVIGGRTRRLADVLSRQGHRVVFVELPTVRGALRPFLRFGTRPAADGSIRVVRLCPLPGYVRLCRTAIARRWEAYAIRRLSAWIPDLAESILVTSTPRWAPVVGALPHAVRCYDYIDHVKVQAGPRGGQVFTEWDEALLRMSDVVTTVAEPLRQHLITRFDRDRVFMVPNGVPAEWLDREFKPVPRSTLAAHPDRIIAGFLGSLFEWVDLELLARVAEALPHVEFSLVGPTRHGVRLDALRRLDNVRCLPAVAFADVPRVIKAFDVCLIPFHRDVIAEYANPLKVYEYCALGKPVVSTVAFGPGGSSAPIIEAEGASQFAAAIEQAAAEDAPEAQARRVAFAREHTWEKRAGDLVAAVGKGWHAASSSFSVSPNTDA